MAGGFKDGHVRVALMCALLARQEEMSGTSTVKRGDFIEVWTWRQPPLRLPGGIEGDTHSNSPRTHTAKFAIRVAGTLAAPSVPSQQHKLRRPRSGSVAGANGSSPRAPIMPTRRLQYWGRPGYEDDPGTATSASSCWRSFLNKTSSRFRFSRNCSESVSAISIRRSDK
jgi:hypothetical protein